jgi:hypothetical protein
MNRPHKDEAPAVGATGAGIELTALRVDHIATAERVARALSWNLALRSDARVRHDVQRAMLAAEGRGVVVRIRRPAPRPPMPRVRP